MENSIVLDSNKIVHISNSDTFSFSLLLLCWPLLSLFQRHVRSSTDHDNLHVTSISWKMGKRQLPWSHLTRVNTSPLAHVNFATRIGLEGDSWFTRQCWQHRDGFPRWKTHNQTKLSFVTTTTRLESVRQHETFLVSHLSGSLEADATNYVSENPAMCLTESEKCESGAREAENSIILPSPST